MPTLSTKRLCEFSRLLFGVKVLGESLTVLRAGVPQVVLPQWTDCYDYAQRVEMLGIGRLGNRTAKPLWTKKELGDVLSEVLLGKSSESIQRKASALAAVVKAKGNGAANAARLLLEECV